jgi:hypothetical protein
MEVPRRPIGSHLCILALTTSASLLSHLRILAHLCTTETAVSKTGHHDPWTAIQDGGSYDAVLDNSRLRRRLALCPRKLPSPSGAAIFHPLGLVGGPGPPLGYGSEMPSPGQSWRAAGPRALKAMYLRPNQGRRYRPACSRTWQIGESVADLPASKYIVKRRPILAAAGSATSGKQTTPVSRCSRNVSHLAA